MFRKISIKIIASLLLMGSTLITRADVAAKVEKLPDNKGWRLPVNLFKGGKGPQLYGEEVKRQAVWVCPRQTGFSTMRASFKLDTLPQEAMSLVIEGQDTDKPGTVSIRILLNNKEIFSGNNGFRKEEWSTRSFLIPQGLLIDGNNELSIENMIDNADGYKWFMVADICIEKRTPNKKRVPDAKSDNNEIELSELKGLDLPYFCWSKDPFASFSLDKVPQPVPLIENLKITAAMNEYQSVSFVISNLLDKAFHGRVVLSSFKNDKTGEIIPADFVDIKSTAFMESRWDKGVTAYPDPLININDAGDITIDSKGNKEIFLILNTKNIPSGKYDAIIDIRPYLSTIPITTLKINLEILPFALPQKKHLSFLVFEINKTLEYWGLKKKIRSADLRVWEFEVRPDLMEEYIKDLIAHGVNVFRIHEGITPAPVVKDGVVTFAPQDIALFDRFLNLYKKYWQDGFLLNICGIHPEIPIEKMGIEYKSEKWKNCLREYFSKLIKHMKDMGFSENEFVLYPFCEVNGKENCEKFIEVVKLIKEVNPNVGVFLTQGGKTSLEDIKILAPGVDIWCLHEPKIKDKEIMDFVKSTNKTVWFYDNGPPYKSTPALLSRSEPWKAFKYDLQGCGSWSYNRFVGDSWDDLDFEKELYYPDMHFVYIGKHGPITSRRWEAYRAGLQDYEYLYMLKEMIQKAKSKGIDTKGNETILENVVKKVTAKRYSPDFADGRAQITAEILRLEEALNK